MSAHYNFRSVVEEFFALKPFTGLHAETLRGIVRNRAQEILMHPDIRYMPAFKILDLLAAMVNTASAVAIEPQLRVTEASALVRASLADGTPLIRQFMLEAALERARYEPMMVSVANVPATELRDLTLRKRWQSMREAHQALAALPDDWMHIIDARVSDAIAAPSFRDYRYGPLLQLFAEMLQSARQLHESGKRVEALVETISEQSALWKRYALKAARYQAKEDALALHLPAQSRVPGEHLTVPPTIH